MPLIASDGSSLGTPGEEGRSPRGPGAYGVVLRFEDDHPRVAGFQQVMVGGKKDTTTGEIELMGFLHALKVVRSFKEAMEADPISSMMCYGDRFTIILDSEYVVTSYLEHIDTWVENRWKTSSFRAIKNQILWQDVHDLRKEVGDIVDIVHQKGHTIKAADIDIPIEVELNDIADRAAGKASRHLRDTGALPTQDPIVWLEHAKNADDRAADMRRLQAFAENILRMHGRAAAVEAFRLATIATATRADRP